jgi:hypothetical protein
MAWRKAVRSLPHCRRLVVVPQPPRAARSCIVLSEQIPHIVAQKGKGRKMPPEHAPSHDMDPNGWVQPCPTLALRKMWGDVRRAGWLPSQHGRHELDAFWSRVRGRPARRQRSVGACAVVIAAGSIVGAVIGRRKETRGWLGVRSAGTCCGDAASEWPDARVIGPHR